jgi:hypothetical protein
MKTQIHDGVDDVIDACDLINDAEDWNRESRLQESFDRTRLIADQIKHAREVGTLGVES